VLQTKLTIAREESYCRPNKESAMQEALQSKQKQCIPVRWNEMINSIGKANK
jgi:hypothetical protein